METPFLGGPYVVICVMCRFDLGVQEFWVYKKDDKLKVLWFDYSVEVRTSWSDYLNVRYEVK